QKFANDGQTVIPAEPIVKIVGLNNLQVAISVPENEISSFGPETTAAVTFNVADRLTVNGKLSRKGVVADPLTRSYTVKFDITNTDGKILPGMIGTVSVDGLSDEGSIENTSQVTLPSQSVLLSADNRQFVWTVKDGKAQRKDVIADELSTDGVIIKSGLTTGDSVIVAGMQKVSTGTDVTAIR
ncbi:MAG: efflux RND transporter periplasmic adaptor subunit, partial [Muribaculaceae bacterium]|nr:efflux RND transporter periplasmic adaptor subunit [Muribaculaceae bacterium]